MSDEGQANCGQGNWQWAVGSCREALIFHLIFHLIYPQSVGAR
jgi:hypothetical protein